MTMDQLASPSSSRSRPESDPVDLDGVRLAGEDAGVAVDRVCATRVRTVGEHAIGVPRHGEQWWFCGPSCVASFASSLGMAT